MRGYTGFIIPALQNCVIKQSEVAFAIKDEAEKYGINGVVAVLAAKKDEEQTPDAKTLLNQFGSVLPIFVPIGEYVIFQTDDDNSEDENHFGVSSEKLAKTLRMQTGKPQQQQKAPKEVLGENKFECGRKVYTSDTHLFYVALSSDKPEINDNIVDDIVVGKLKYAAEK